jgi:hypothetical protein
MAGLGFPTSVPPANGPELQLFKNIAQNKDSNTKQKDENHFLLRDISPSSGLFC